MTSSSQLERKAVQGIDFIDRLEPRQKASPVLTFFYEGVDGVTAGPELLA